MRSGRSLAILGVAAAVTFLVGVALDLHLLRILVKLSALGDVLLEVSPETFLYGIMAT